MVYRMIDQVTADCLAEGDLILIDDASTSEMIYFLIDEVDDQTDKIVVEGRDIQDTESEFTVSLDPDTRIDLYMEVDED